MFKVEKVRKAGRVKYTAGKPKMTQAQKIWKSSVSAKEYEGLSRKAQRYARQQAKREYESYNSELADRKNKRAVAATTATTLGSQVASGTTAASIANHQGNSNQGNTTINNYNTSSNSGNTTSGKHSNEESTNNPNGSTSINSTGWMQ